MYPVVRKWLYQHYDVVLAAAVAFLILGPLLKSGFILTLDMAWTPRWPFPQEMSSSYLLRLSLFASTRIFPSDGVQKFLLWSVFFLMGWGSQRLLREFAPAISRWAVAFGGLFCVINPFTYSRWLDGHWNVLFGYALLPFWLHSLWKLSKTLSLTQTLRTTIWMILISIVSIHTMYMVALLLLLTVISVGWQQRHNTWFRLRGLAVLTVMVSVTVLASSYWLDPFLRQQTSQAQQIQTFDQRHLLAFRTVPDEQLGLLPNVLALYGYWGDAQDRYLLPKNLNPLWPGFLLLLLVLTGVGVRQSWQRWSHFTGALSTAAVISWLLALGVSFPPLAPTYRWLIDHLPYFAGYREPQKWLAVVALAYAFFAAQGANWTYQQVRSRSRGAAEALQLFLLLFPCLFTPLMLWGGAGQLKAVQYPADWYVVNEQLRNQSGRALFLPWNQYIRFGFADRVISNPAENFFSIPIIQSHRAEIGLLSDPSGNADEHWVETEILAKRGSTTDWAEILATKGVKYVIVAKEIDWTNYSFLDHQENLPVLRDSESLRIYENLVYREFEAEKN